MNERHVRTKEKFVVAIKEKHGGTEYEKKYLAAIDFIEIQLGIKEKMG